MRSRFGAAIAVAVPFCVLLTIGVPPASPGTTTPSSSAFVRRSGPALYLGTQRVRFTGVNMYTANLRNNCVSGYSEGYNNTILATDLQKLDHATAGRARFIRAWFFQHLATTSGRRDWSAFDHTLSAARANHMRVIAVLANGWGTCEASGATDTNGVGYRDITWYQHRYTDSVDEGGITSFRTWVRQVVSRYRNNPTVLAWQLINEGNAGTYVAHANGNFPCPDPGAAHRALVAWAGDVSSTVKAADPNHLVSIGTLNNSCGTWQGDNVSIAAVRGNDLCDYHDYGAPLTAMPASLQYMISHCAAIGRPTIVSESGISFAEVGNSLSVRAQRFGTKLNAAFSKSDVAGYIPWVWNGSGKSLDNQFELIPTDPSLSVLASHGVRLPNP